MKELCVRGLSVEYDSGARRVAALDDATFSLRAGRVLGVAGESACGKSTLGLAIMRSIEGGRVTAGSVELDGTDLLAVSDAEYDARYRWKRISMVFQAAMSSLDPAYTVGEQMREVRGASAAEAAGAMRDVGLDAGVSAMYPHELSGGMRQRVAVAMAVAPRPDVIVADEPTTSLDVLAQDRIVGCIMAAKDRGAAIIMITHDLALLSGVADEIAVMYAGQLVELGAAREVCTEPRHPYTRALLAATPSLEGRAPSQIPGSAPRPERGMRGCRFAPRCAEEFEKCADDPPAVRVAGGYARCWLHYE